MKPILEIQDISKKFRISHQTGGYLSLRERMVNALKFEKNSTEDFWALKDVSFEVQPGESIGIIGRNGAGKSTLLKILSKITPPTQGKIISRGRIASLLEVGTGFHPELTGRENIFFNGSLLGMKRKEIENKFDEIVDFSGVEKFLDTPLKHYSSGMQLRLAFAVAAFLEPEILIIDEVLAVGDAEFQKKCLGKMEDVSKQGRTVLFVSHNLPFVSSLCKRGIMLSEGLIEKTGKSNDVIAYYLSKTELTDPLSLIDKVVYSCDYFKIDKIKLNGTESIFQTNENNLLLIDVEFSLQQDAVVELEFHIRNMGEYVVSFGNFTRNKLAQYSAGQHHLHYELILPDLLSGKYSADIHFTYPMEKNLASIENIALPEIINRNLNTRLKSDVKNWSKVILNGHVTLDH